MTTERERLSKTHEAAHILVMRLRDCNAKTDNMAMAILLQEMIEKVASIRDTLRAITPERKGEI